MVDVFQRIRHMVEGMGQMAQLVGTVLRGTLRQIAGGDAVGHPGEVPDGTRQTASQQIGRAA